MKTIHSVLLFTGCFIFGVCFQKLWGDYSGITNPVIAMVSGTIMSMSITYFLLRAITIYLNDPASTSQPDLSFANAMEKHRAAGHDMLRWENERGDLCADRVLQRQLLNVSDAELMEITRRLLALTKERGISLDTDIEPRKNQVVENIL